MDLGRGDENVVQLETTTLPVQISPRRTALVVVDMQNFFLHPVFRSHPSGLSAYETLVSSTIPSCQKAGIDIIFVNWGLTEYDLATMPPMLHRSFSKDIVDVMPQGVAPQSSATDAKMEEAPRTMSVKPEHPAAPIYIGLGRDLGTRAFVSSNGDTSPITAGRVLMRGSWNAGLYGGLDEVYRQLGPHAGSPAQLPEEKRQSRAYLAHKNRLSGLWGQTTPLEELLHSLDITTLLFAGVNTDQCVSGTMGDAFSKGFDCILLTDACGTTSPQYMSDAVYRNAERCWGFVSSSDKLAATVTGLP
ncbi:Isochorismatase hydrolase [Clavulina sp. PMI_390]|nr:Isochorismatase hydrolase [Clavulina sp. PMI_390]